MEYEYDQEKLNSAGQREGELIHTSYDEKTEYKHLYKSGKLIETTNYRYFVEGKKELVGRYKDGNPFQGYFVYRNELEIPLIDYYENGVFMSQYTCSLLDLIQFEGQEFNLKFTKTTYKNNKPYDGLFHKEEFRLDGAHLLASEYYKDGKITNVDFWIMALHYAELIKMKFLPDGYMVYKESLPNVEDPEVDNKFRSITVEFENPENGNVLFEVENKLITKYHFSYSDISQNIKPLAGIVSYFFFDDNTVLKTQNYNLKTDKILYNEAYGSNSNLISQVFLMINNQPVPHFSNEGKNDYSLLLDLDKRINTNSVLYLDEKGNPVRGFLIEKEKQDKYKYTYYEDSKIISKKDALTLESLKGLILKEKK
ncbi:hypothetical protein DMB65_07975 [Flavobacterium cheongpyeongense]|uniref:Uncharacterized protein n=2 Tax=Flavobacterium cheongpyeongense TaxID=2212651 RepID=A0A2V4BQY1_9FLAO|nr:hypothetical protein DMB65_07975 [Flavobacterium cheongpyeongense]